MDGAWFGVIAPHPPILVPEVGGTRSEVTRSSLEALRRARGALSRFRPECVVLMSPHAPAAADAFLIDDSEVLSGSLSAFGDDSVHAYRGDASLAAEIGKVISDMGHAAVLRSRSARFKSGWLDHASLVPLRFLDPNGEYALVVLSLSGLGYPAHRDVGVAVRSAAARLERRIAFVASGDLSHRLTVDAPAGFSPRARELDDRIRQGVESGDLSHLMHLDATLIEEGGECGLRSIIAMSGFCPDDPAPTRVLAYEGPWGVGYLTALVGDAALAADTAAKPVTPQSGLKGGSPGDKESEIVLLARHTIEALLAGETPPPAILTGPSYPARAGVFVSLHRNNALRGCIGTVEPTCATLAEEVARNAVQAAVHDPRFPSLASEELSDLEMSVDVLHAAEPATRADLDPESYGVIVTSGWRRGLLLPALEGVDDVATQLGIALRKGGIRADEPYEIERFKVDRYT